ncbi:MAG: hypothetical protein IT350_20220 [Deltaproteobacteria bacterium]|nr:hypothetical protein [Deltaproteobacteria bacterium]
MPKVSPIQSAFSTGELSPLLYGQVEFDNYKSALQVCRNWLPLIQGPITRRPATYFCDEVKDSSKEVRLVRFKYSTQQAYMLEFGHQYIRFKRENAPITLTAQGITAVTNASPCVLTYSGADTYANGDDVDITGVVGMTELNGRRFRVTNLNAGANTFQLLDLGGSPINSTNYGVYVSGGTVAEVYEIVSPYDEDQLFQLKFVQSADVLYITHPEHTPRKLSRTSDTSWTLTSLNNSLLLDGPYLAVNTTATTLTPGAATGTGVTLAASSIVGINGGTGFQTTDVGRLIRIKEGSTWGYARIATRVDALNVTIDIINTLTNTNAKTFWRLGLYSNTTGYPAAVGFYEDRLVLAGCPATPSRVDLSRSGDYENFAQTDPDGVVTDSHALSYTLNSDEVQIILWVKGDEKALVVGTVDGEWPMRPSTASEAMTPTNISAKQSTARGSADIQGIRAGDAILFVQTAKRQLRELAYVFEADKFKTPDLTVLSEHITKGESAETTGIKSLDYQKQPQSIVWCPRNDGRLLSLTYERDQKVLAWAPHALGGFSDGNQTEPAAVESVACMPSADGTRDEVWLSVQRVINGRTVRYNEYMTKVWEKGDIQADAIYGDCALTYDGTPISTVTGLWHLIGETVGVLVDGAAHPDCVVSTTGTITLTSPASKVQVGLRYASDGQMLRQDVGAADGTSQGKYQRTHNVNIRVHDTLGMKFGSGFHATGPGKLTEPTIRTSAVPGDTAVPLYSGDIEIRWEGTYTKNNYVTWRNDSMFPATILAVMPQLHTQDR